MKEYLDYQAMTREVKKRILAQLDMHIDVPDDKLLNLIDEEIINISSSNPLSLNKRIQMRNTIFNSFRKLDVLQELVDDKSITEIMINSYKDIFIERNGRIIKWNGRFESRDKYNDVIQMIVSKINRVVNESNPIADARLEDGSRVNIVLSPVSLGDNAVTIRKFPEKVLSINDLIEKGSLNKEVADFLELLVKARYNILLSGGTSSGKTTMLNALAGYIPSDERIITIEDSAELQINSIPNIVRLEVKNANMEGAKSITIRDLIKSSLRMRPDRVIIGEVRDSAAIDLLSAYNTGHDGSLSTAHSNSSRDMLTRIENMVLMGIDMPVAAIRRQIVSAIDIIVHVARLRDKSRKIVEIAEIVGMEGDEIKLNYLYRYKEDENTTKEKVAGHLIRNEEGLYHRQKLEDSGNTKEYEDIFKRYAQQ